MPWFRELLGAMLLIWSTGITRPNGFAWQVDGRLAGFSPPGGPSAQRSSFFCALPKLGGDTTRLSQSLVLVFRPERIFALVGFMEDQLLFAVCSPVFAVDFGPRFGLRRGLLRGEWDSLHLRLATSPAPRVQRGLNDPQEQYGAIWSNSELFGA